MSAQFTLRVGKINNYLGIRVSKTIQQSCLTAIISKKARKLAIKDSQQLPLTRRSPLKQHSRRGVENVYRPRAQRVQTEAVSELYEDKSSKGIYLDIGSKGIYEDIGSKGIY